MGEVEALIPSGTRRFAVVGDPVAHSLSPVMHRAAYRELGVDDARYDARTVAAGELRAFLDSGAGRGMSGLSVTMPLKPEALRLARERDAVSAALGVANTLLALPEGGWRAENHDVDGIVRSLRDHGADRVGTAAILGSGATAMSAAAALVRLGVHDVSLTARTPERLAPVAAVLEHGGARVRVRGWDDAAAVLDCEVAISALAVDGAVHLARRLQLARVDGPRRMLDVLYDPWPAPVARVLGERGSEVASGLEMLAHQAARQVESMLGVAQAPVAVMLDAARAEIRRRSEGPRPSR